MFAAEPSRFEADYAKWMLDDPRVNFAISTRGDNSQAEGENVIRINQQRLSFGQHATAAEIAWGDLGVDVALECTGKFLPPKPCKATRIAAPSAPSWLRGESTS